MQLISFWKGTYDEDEIEKESKWHNTKGTFFMVA